MINILLSVRLPWPGKILSGEKTWELRKNAPRLKKGDSVTLWLYESGQYGTRGIIGKCQLKYLIPVISRVPIWLPSKACVTEEYLQNYLPCKAWGIYAPVRLPNAVPLSAIGLTRPPQSWQYLTDKQADILERRLA